MFIIQLKSKKRKIEERKAYKGKVKSEEVKSNPQRLAPLGGLVPVTGVEPVRYRYHRILSPARLPIPSHRHITLYIIHYDTVKIKCFL